MVNDVADPKDLIKEFAEAMSGRNTQRLAALLDEDVRVQFDEAGEFIGRHGAMAFLRRLFQSYSSLDMRIVKLITDDDMVIAETAYAMGYGRGDVTSVRAISVFDIQANVIVRWTDRADLGEVPSKELERWRRLGSARW